MHWPLRRRSKQADATSDAKPSSDAIATGMYCRGCGYDLTHLPHDRCPECGRSFNPADTNTYVAFSHPRFVRTWMHLPLVGVTSVVGFFGGAMLGAASSIFLVKSITDLTHATNSWLAPIIMCICFFGGAFGGMRGLSGLVIRLLPVNCPRCFGPAYYQPGKQVVYRCRRCGNTQTLSVARR